MSFHLNVGQKLHRIGSTVSNDLYSVDGDVKPHIK